MLHRLFIIGSIVMGVGVGGAITFDALSLPFVNLFVFAAGAGFVLDMYARACLHFEQVNRPANQAWDEGYESGYEKGWREGRSSKIPKITRLRRNDSGSRDGMG